MYDQLAEDYDRFVDWESRLRVELPFIEKILGNVEMDSKQPPHILDAACGTGMHALALAQRGYLVTGADQSSQMILAARHNSAKAALTVDFENVGFGKLANRFGKEQFDAVLCLGNSLPHLLTDSDLKNALSDFLVCLKKGGLLVIQNRNFDAVMKNRNRWMSPQEFQEGYDQWVFQRFYDFDSDDLIRFNMVTLKRTGDLPWESRVDSTYLRPLLQADLKKALESAGFDCVCSYGNLMGESFDPLNSENLILINKK